MAYDLRFEKWLPFRRASGAVEWLSPCDITDRIDDDPIVSLASPRPDFDAALAEFLIGIFTVALAPSDETEWGVYWRTPPDKNTLQAKLKGLPEAFYLDGDGPRIFQDLDLPTNAKKNPVEALLIDAAGQQAIDQNTDLFVKRGRVPKLGRAAAAMALITMQSFAPSGGAGHRTSLRGGGPLVTLVEPRGTPHREPLWQLIWANAETAEQLAERDGDRTRVWKDADRYPWLEKTKTSDTKNSGRPTSPSNAAPEQVYFALPRRIRLDFEEGECVCAITSKSDTSGISSFGAQNYGVNYLGWVHPLTPYYYDSKSGLLPRHGQTGGVGWRDWQSLLFVNPNNSGSKPATTVVHFTQHRADGPFRLIAAGYNNDNAKASSWVQAELPAFPEKTLTRTNNFAQCATTAAQLVARQVSSQVKAGLFQRPKDARGDFKHLEHELWRRTQSEFYRMVGKIAGTQSIDAPELREQFGQALRDAALAIFDEACPVGDFQAASLRRPIVARNRLSMTLNGYGKDGDALFSALNITKR